MRISMGHLRKIIREAIEAGDVDPTWWSHFPRHYGGSTSAVAKAEHAARDEIRAGLEEVGILPADVDLIVDDGRFSYNFRQIMRPFSEDPSSLPLLDAALSADADAIKAADADLKAAEGEREKYRKARGRSAAKIAALDSAVNTAKSKKSSLLAPITSADKRPLSDLAKELRDYDLVIFLSRLEGKYDSATLIRAVDRMAVAVTKMMRDKGRSDYLDAEARSIAASGGRLD